MKTILMPISLISFRANVIGLILAVSVLPSTPVIAASFTQMLDHGSYTVGFRSFWTADPSRSYGSQNDGEIDAAAVAPRPMLIAIWYPAVAGESASPMPYGEYLESLESPPAYAELAQRYARSQREIVVEEVTGSEPGELENSDGDHLARLFETRTRAYRNLEPVAGRFPLLLYHSGAGSTFEDNAMLSEYLASHGYVVISSSYLRADGSSLGVDGGETSVADMHYIASRAADWAPVDPDKIAVGGHSLGGQVVMRFLASGLTPVDAAVILDTTQDYHSTENRTWLFIEQTERNIPNYSAPMLVAADPSAVFQLVDRLIVADRYYLTSPILGHDEYISQGMMRLDFLDAIGAESPSVDERAAVRRENIALAHYIRLFLDANLQDDTQAALELATIHRDATYGEELHAYFMSAGESREPPFDLAANVPPTPRQLRYFLADNGLEHTLELLSHTAELTPDAPIFEGVYGSAWSYELYKTGHLEAAARIYRFYEQLPGNSIGVASLFFCRFPLLGGRTEFARDCLKALLFVDPDNVEAQETLSSL